jgi:putative sigma-54 modulation protein
MQLVVTGRHMSVSDAMKAYAEKRLQKLTHFFNRIVEIRVVLDYEGSNSTVECIVDVEHTEDLVAREVDADMYKAIDAVADKLERQLKAHKERLNQRHKIRPSESAPPAESE